MSELQTLAVQLDGLKTKWIAYRQQDDQKRSLIENLFEYIKVQSQKLSDAEYELCDKRDVIKLNRNRVEEAEKRIQVLQLEKARHAFALVLVDGDCMPFTDELVKEGIDGGKRAASLLKQAVEEELRTSNSSAAQHVQVVVRVYANMKGLAKTYKDMDILPQAASFEDFVRGFNMGDVMCDYVDAGNGKECSDEKIKAVFRRDLADVHCQRIFFGGTADNGYARLLGPLAEDEAVCGRITLLEGPPFARELAEIKDRFHTASFEKVFRCQKLSNLDRRVSFNLTPPRTPSVDYASAAAIPPSKSAPASIAASKPGSTASNRPVTTGVLLNKMGQRVDSPLDYSYQDFTNVRSQKLCNALHLLGRCPFVEKFGKCQHDHDAKLSTKQLVALRAVARQSPCQTGLFCRDLECVGGHRCSRDRCSRADCWFPDEMHNVDTIVVGRV